jgi:hypothetical protein
VTGLGVPCAAKEATENPVRSNASELLFMSPFL